MFFGVEWEYLMLFFFVNSDGNRKYIFICLLLVEVDKFND